MSLYLIIHLAICLVWKNGTTT